MTTQRVISAVLGVSALTLVAACGSEPAEQANSLLAAPRPIVVGELGSSATPLAAESADARLSSTADMSIAGGAPIGSMTFVAGDTLGPLPTNSTGWEFPAGVVPTDAQISAVAAALGVEGEITAIPANEGGGWRVGPNDGSAAAVVVSSTGALDWYYNAPYETFVDEGSVSVGSSGSDSGSGSAEPVGDIEQPEEIDVAPDKSEVAVDPIAPDDTWVEPPPPEGILTQAEAEARGREILAALGVDVAGFTVTAYGDEWIATANFAGTPEQGTAGKMFDFGFGANGELQWGSGQLANPVATGPFPLVDLDVAVERLNEQYNWSAQAFRDDVLMMEPEEASTEVVTELVDPAVGAPEPMPAEDVTVEPMPVDKPMPIEGDGGIGDGSTGGEMPDPIDVTVTLVSVESGIWWTTEADGSTWLLPAYNFVGDDGGEYLVPAVTDEFLVVEPVATVDPIPEPMPVETVPGDTVPVDETPAPPATEPAVDPETPTTEPLVVESTTTAPVDEKRAVGITDADTAAMIGLTAEELRAVADPNGWLVCGLADSPELDCIQEMFDVGRVTVVLADDLVTSAIAG